jgi:thiamine biosynthesis protein ThiS
VRTRRSTLNSVPSRVAVPLRITLNGEPYDLDEPLSVADLLAKLAIDPRRVAVEHNLTVVRRADYDKTMVEEADEVEIVNFVGGGSREPC